MIHSGYDGSVHLFRGKPGGGFEPSATPKLSSGEDMVFTFKLKYLLPRDWNGDGHMDLIAFKSTETMLYPGLGDGTFGEPVPIRSNGNDIGFSYATAALADWDGDGVEDLWVGHERGGAYFYKGTGQKTGDHAFHTPVPHFPPRTSRVQPIPALPEGAEPPEIAEAYGRFTGTRTHVSVWDWNGDGLLDLVIGDMRQAVYRPEHPTPEATELIDSFLNLQEEFASSVERAEAALSASPWSLTQSQQSGFSRQLSELLAKDPLYETRATKLFELNHRLFRVTQHLKGNSYVWVYLQKPRPTETQP